MMDELPPEGVTVENGAPGASEDPSPEVALALEPVSDEYSRGAGSTIP